MHDNLRLNESIEVEHDGEIITIWNWMTVEQPASVRGHNPVVEKYEPDIYAGDSQMVPEYATPWVAEELDAEFGIDVTDHGIEIVNPESEEVPVL